MYTIVNSPETSRLQPAIIRHSVVPASYEMNLQEFEKIEIWYTSMFDLPNDSPKSLQET